MTIVLNGKSEAVEAVTLEELCASLGFTPGAKIATAVNGAFVPQAQRGAFRLSPDDQVEIVSPRQGG